MNIFSNTSELLLFGWPKRGKSESRHQPLREATSPARFEHFLGHSFKTPEYCKYDGTADPQFHLLGFLMNSHQWLYDRVLMVHLFQQSLEGEALRWFTSLHASNLINFDIVSKRFISHFSYMATQVPTLPNLVAEKMRPDEDFVTFANRWSSMASRADLPIPETLLIFLEEWAFRNPMLSAPTMKACTCLPPAFFCRVTKLLTMLASWFVVRSSSGLARCSGCLLLLYHSALDAISEIGRIFYAYQVIAIARQPRELSFILSNREENLEKIYSTIAAYDNSKRVVKGKITLQLEIGPVTMSSEFQVLDVDPAYKAILGCPWLEQSLGLPSTAHQCFKFPFNGRVIKIKSIPTVETLNSITSEQMPHLFIPDKGKKPIMSIIDLPSPLDFNQPPFINEEFETATCSQGKVWEAMAKIGYIHGRGLGKDSVATELLVAIVIRVATTWCFVFLSRPVNGSRQGSSFWSYDACRKWLVWQSDLSGRHGVPGGRVLVAVWTAVALRLLTRRGAPLRSEGRPWPAPLSLSLLSLPFSSPRGKSGSLFHLRAWSVVALTADRAELGAASWSEEEVFLLSRRPCGVCVRRNIRGGVTPVGRDLIATQLAIALRACRDLVSCRDKLVVATRCPVATWCLFRLPYLSRWLSPFPGTPILGSLLREFSGLRACSISPSHCLTVHWFHSHLGRVGVGPQLGRAAVGGSTCGPSTLWRSEVAMPVVRRSFSCGCSVSQVVTPCCSFLTLWRSGMLGACVVRLWSHVVAPVFYELLYLGWCMPRCCFRIVFDSAGSTGVVVVASTFVGVPAALAGKPKGRKAPAAPTIEGVTVNESVSACSQPLRPPNKPSNPPSNPSNPHQFPSHPSKTYSAVPPPAGYTRPGPKRSHYPPLPETLEDIFFAFMSCDAIQLPPQRENTNPRVDTSRYCPYHRNHGHDITNCFTFRDWVYDMNDQGRVNWDDVKVAIAKSREQQWGVEGFEEWYPCPVAESQEPSTSVDTILEEKPLVLIRPPQDAYPIILTPSACESSAKPLQLVLPKSQETVLVTLRNRIVPPPPRPSHDEEDNGPPPLAGTEYDILQHLDKTPARVSILELIWRSPSHQSTLLQFLQKIMVNDDLPPSGVTNAILCLTQGPSISFSDKDLVTPECRSLPLCLTVNLNGVSVDSTLIDTGASIHVCPVKTLKQLGLGEGDLEKNCSTIAAYDNSKRVAKGKISLKLGIGPVIMSTEFLVLDVDPAYKAILGRPLLEQTLGVPSTAHQCFKIPFNGWVIKIKSIPTLETLNAIATEQMPHLFIPDKGKKPVMSLFDFPLPCDVSQPPQSVEESYVPCPPGKGWEVMANIGYVHGLGL
ncbi:hypothetical protein Taro_033293, partial [Colocasia esculenta]|nr:hypothetical protein [Colocasia esculenta]